jgi:hypothetical protein
MSGPKVFHVVTREELVARCQAPTGKGVTHLRDEIASNRPARAGGGWGRYLTSCW